MTMERALRLVAITFAILELGLCTSFEDLLDSVPLAARHKRQADRIIETDKCNPIAFKEFLADQDECFQKANLLLFEGLEQGDFFQGICNQLVGKVACIGKSDVCFDDNKEMDVKLTFLRKEYDRIRNDSNLNSFGVIESCPAYNNFQSEYLNFVAGTDRKCTFDEYWAGRRAYTACNDEVYNTRETMAALSSSLGRNGKTLLYRAYCNARRDWDTKCNPLLFRCLSDDKARTIINHDKEAYAKNEQSFVKAGFDFTYASSC